MFRMELNQFDLGPHRLGPLDQVSGGEREQIYLATRLALAELLASTGRQLFEEAMDRMGSDPEIRRESKAVYRDFLKAEGDGLGNDD